jgi:hypothetical protein
MKKREEEEEEGVGCRIEEKKKENEMGIFDNKLHECMCMCVCMYVCVYVSVCLCKNLFVIL